MYIYSLSKVDTILAKPNNTSSSLEDQLKELLEKLDLTCMIKHGVARSKRAKQLKREINVIRRKLAIQKAQKEGGEASIQDLAFSAEGSSSKFYTKNLSSLLLEIRT